MHKRSVRVSWQWEVRIKQGSVTYSIADMAMEVIVGSAPNTVPRGRAGL